VCCFGWKFLNFKPKLYDKSVIIRTPDLVCMGDGKISEKIGIHLMFFIRNARILVGIDRLYSEYLHQLDRFVTSDAVPFRLQKLTHSSSSEKRMICIESIKPREQYSSFRIDYRNVVVSGSWDTEELYLAGDGERGKIYIYQRKFSFMVTFRQAVYIFFSSSHVQSWAVLFVGGLRRELLLFLWEHHLSFWGPRMHL
jgi:hypothetical protein